MLYFVKSAVTVAGIECDRRSSILCPNFPTTGNMKAYTSCALVFAAACSVANGFVSPSTQCQQQRDTAARSVIFSTPKPNDQMAERSGGFTTKQRLREEIESPFRKVRLAFFAFSSASAAVALYFSALTALKAQLGGFQDIPPIEEALVQFGINLAGVIGFGALAVREVKVGEKNLQRIAKGGQLARLIVEPAQEGSELRTLQEYRRASRVVLAAGGIDYINKLSLSLCSDQLADENNLPAALEEVDLVIVPILLNEKYELVDTKEPWRNAVPSDLDRNFDSSRADNVVAFPHVRGAALWNQYLESEIETALGQGFDVLSGGFTITVKKNGRILRRATGLPPYGDFVSMMEVADGSRFGMPGDSERYGGP